MLEVSLLGVGTVLRLERDAWSMAKWLRQTYIYILFFKQMNNPLIKKKLTHLVYYKYQQRSVQR